MKYSDVYFSLELFLYENVTSQSGVLLINQDDAATRLEEILDTDRAIIWHTNNFSAENKGEITLFVNATTTKDPGGIVRLGLVDIIKTALDSNAGIPVYEYSEGVKVGVEKINELAIIGPVKIWPAFNDDKIDYTSKPVSQKLKFAQRR